MWSLSRHAATLILLLSLFASSAVAQRVERVDRTTTGASYRVISLSDSDINGQSFRLAGARAAGLWAGLTAHVDYQFALNTSMRDAVRGDWTNYRAVLIGVGGYFEPLWFQTGAVMHRFRLGLGPTLRYQKREHPQLLAYPAAYEEGRISSNMGYDRRYQERLEGEDLEQEGMYTLFTTEESGTEVGTQLEAVYRLHIGRFIVGMDGDLHLFGERVLGYGLFVGLRW